MLERSKMSPSQLMKAVGSPKGYDPIPPPQYLTFQNSRYPPAMRVWAWLLSKTIRAGHRTPYATDDAGAELKLSDCAAQLKMNAGNVSRAWQELETEGRVRRDGRKLAIAGDFDLPMDYLTAPAEVKTTPVKLPPYIVHQVNTLDLAQKKAFWAEAQQATGEHKAIHSDLVAFARKIHEEALSKIFEKYCIKVQKRAKSREKSDMQKAIEVPVREFLNSSRSCNKTEVVQQLSGGSILIDLNTEVNTEKTSSSPTPPQLEKAATPEDGRRRTIAYPLTLQEMQTRFATASEGTAIRLFRACVATLKAQGLRTGDLSDELLANAVAVSNRESTGLKTPGGYMTDVPPIILKWIKTGIPKESTGQSEADRDAASRAKIRKLLEHGNIDPTERAALEALLLDPMPAKSEMQSTAKRKAL